MNRLVPWVSHTSDPPELDTWYALNGVCRPPPFYRGGFAPLFDGPFVGWVVCELDDSGTAPTHLRAWQICRAVISAGVRRGVSREAAGGRCVP